MSSIWCRWFGIGCPPPTTTPPTPIPEPKPPVAVTFHVQDPAGKGILGANLKATSVHGPWEAYTDGEGNFTAHLGAGHYDLTISATGFKTRTLPADIGDPGTITIGLEVSFPAIPSRDQVCALRTSLQGLTYNTTEFGPIPAWFYPGLNDTDRAIARAAHKAVGDTHIPISISAAYKESGTLWPEKLKAGYDFAYDLEALRAVLMPLIQDGFFIDLPLAGDGLSKVSNPGPGDYNDPVGNTYGYEWLMSNLPRIIVGLKGDGTPSKPDLTPFILFRPGWDGVFYGWSPEHGETPDRQPERVKKFGELFRSQLPDGHLAIEHTPGNIPCGEGGGDFAPGGLMTTYDTILSEFNTVHEDSCWQVVARMVPSYIRPPDQPAGDDPNPPHYLAPGNSRGKYFYVAFEPTKGGVYEWCRGYCSLEDVQAVRAYLKSMGVELTG